MTVARVLVGYSTKKFHNLTPSTAIQRRSWLVSQDQPGFISKRTSYRYPLLFAPGKHVGQIIASNYLHLGYPAIP